MIRSYSCRHSSAGIGTLSIMPSPADARPSLPVRWVMSTRVESQVTNSRGWIIGLFPYFFVHSPPLFLSKQQCESLTQSDLPSFVFTTIRLVLLFPLSQTSACTNSPFTFNDTSRPMLVCSMDRQLGILWRSSCFPMTVASICIGQSTSRISVPKWLRLI